MREWLLRLLGVPRPIVIEVDVAAIKAAGHDALVILHTNGPLTSEERRYAQGFFADFRKKNPDVRFLLLDGKWDVCVAPEGTTAKGWRS